jgi:hypothetical protein
MNQTIALLEEVAEFLEPYVDVRDGEDGPLPNKAMNLLGEVEREIERLKGTKTTPKKLGFVAAVREYGDNWRQSGFQWNGESYRGLSPATMMALDDELTPDWHDMHHMKGCSRWGRAHQVSE